MAAVQVQVRGGGGLGQAACPWPWERPQLAEVRSDGIVRGHTGPGEHHEERQQDQHEGRQQRVGPQEGGSRAGGYNDINNDDADDNYVQECHQLQLRNLTLTAGCPATAGRLRGGHAALRA